MRKEYNVANELLRKFEILPQYYRPQVGAHQLFCRNGILQEMNYFESLKFYRNTTDHKLVGTSFIVGIEC